MIRLDDVVDFLDHARRTEVAGIAEAVGLAFEPYDDAAGSALSAAGFQRAAAIRHARLGHDDTARVLEHHVDAAIQSARRYVAAAGLSRRGQP